MDTRDLERLLGRWQERGLVSHDQTLAILAYEAEEGVEEGGEPHTEAAPAIDFGAVLSYGGVLVALVAVIGLYVTVLDEIDPWAGFGVYLLVAVAAVALAFVMTNLGGASAADALGLAAVVLVGWAVFQFFQALGWTVEDGESDFRFRLSWLLTGLAAAGVGWGLARTVPASLAALASAASLTGSFAILGWMFAAENDDAPGALGGQMAVVAGFVAAALALFGNVLLLEQRARAFWIIGALTATNLAAFILSAAHGGVYEGLLLPYAVVLGVLAVVLRRRTLIVFAALFLYEYVGFVVFRTFGGAVAAIIVLALVGLGTAVGGMTAQRGLLPGFLRRA